MNQRTSELTVDNQRAHTAEVENTDEHRFTKRRGRPSPATKNLTAETQVVRKNRSAGVSPASEPRQLLLGQHDLCRLEAGDTFFLTTAETRRFRPWERTLPACPGCPTPCTQDACAPQEPRGG